MAAQNAVRTVHIRGVSDGLDRLERDLRAVGDAQENLAQASEATARTTETASRRQLSVAGAYNRLRSQIDQQFRAQQQLERGQQTLDRAFQQGLATQAEYDRAMAQLRERYLSAAAANDNFRAANDNAARSVERSTGLVDRLKSSVSQLVLAYAGVQGVRMLGGMADEWSELQSRVVNATGSFEAGQAVLGRLGEMARRTYSDLDRTAESWLSASTSLTALGVSISDQLDLVESFNNALVISATRGQRAESVQRAWSDAMSLGKMNLQQFNTIMTGSDRLAKALADAMGVNVLELRRLASEGKITRQSMLGLSSQLETLREEADRMPATIADGMTLIRNALLMTIGMMDQAGGASESFAAGLVIIADNMQRIVTYAMTAAAAYGTYHAATLALDVASKGLAASLALVRAALIRIGIGALIVGVGELVYQFGRLVEATGSISAALVEFGRRAELVFDAVRFGFFALSEAMKAVWYAAMAEILRTTEEHFGLVLRLFGVSAEAMSAAIESAGYRAEEWGKIAKSSALIASEQFKAAFADITIPGVELPGASGGSSIADTLGKADKAARKPAEAYEKIVAGAYEFIEAQKLELAVIGLSAREANRLRYEHDLLNQAKRAGIQLTADQTAQLQGLAAQMAAAEQATRAAKEMQDAFNAAAQGMGGVLRGMIDGSKDLKQSLMDLIPVVLKLLNTMNIAGGGTGLFGGGVLQNFLGGLLGVGFSQGGYTGPGAASQPAGIVHAGEYVFSKSAVDRIGIGYLDSLHTAAQGYMTGGPVRAHVPANANLRGYQSGGFVRSASARQEPLEIELVSRFDADGGFETAVARTSRPIARQESARAAGKVASAVPSMVDARGSEQQFRRVRPGGGF